MAKSREVYFLTGTTIEAVKTQLNTFLSRLSDRIDKLEGIRGELETASGEFSGDITADGSDVLVKDEDGALIHSME